MPDAPKLEVVASEAAPEPAVEETVPVESLEPEPVVVNTDRLAAVARGHGWELLASYADAAEMCGEATPIALLEHERCVPLGITDGILTVAVAEPFNASSLARISVITPEHTRFVGAPGDEIAALFARWRAEAAPEPTPEQRIEARIETLAAQMEAAEADRYELQNMTSSLSATVERLIETVTAAMERPEPVIEEPVEEVPQPDPLPQVDVEELVGLFESRLPNLVAQQVQAILPAPPVIEPDAELHERVQQLSTDMSAMREAQEQWQRTFAAETQDRLVSLLERMNDALAAVALTWAQRAPTHEAPAEEPVAKVKKPSKPRAPKAPKPQVVAAAPVVAPPMIEEVYEAPEVSEMLMDPDEALAPAPEVHVPAAKAEPGEMPVVQTTEELFALLEEQEDDEIRYAPPNKAFAEESEARSAALQAQLMSSPDDPVAQRLAEMLAMAPAASEESTVATSADGLDTSDGEEEEEEESGGGIMGSLKKMFRKAS